VRAFFADDQPHALGPALEAVAGPFGDPGSVADLTAWLDGRRPRGGWDLEHGLVDSVGDVAAVDRVPHSLAYAAAVLSCFVTRHLEAWRTAGRLRCPWKNHRSAGRVAGEDKRQVQYQTENVASALPVVVEIGSMRST
jgi:hypothetical protein